MLIRQSKNAFIRIFSRYAYVENQTNHVSMTYTGDEMKFVSCLSRKAQDLECVAGNAGIGISVAGELAKNLADLWFVVIGDCEAELDAREVPFSYDAVADVERRFAGVQGAMPAEADGEPWLRSLQIEITSYCNERCIHCYIPGEVKECGETMPVDRVKAIIDEFADMGGLRIILSGGEFFMHKDTVEILTYCRRRDLMILLQSNLTLVDDEMIHFLRELNVFNVQVSLYSTDEATHDMITRLKGSWRKTKENLEKLVANNIPALIACPIMKQNYKGYRDMMDYARSLRLFCYTDYVLLARNDFCDANLCTRLSLSQTSELLDEILAADPAYMDKLSMAESEKNLDAIEFAQRFNRCSVLKNNICISVNGDAYPCPAWQRMVLGNVHTMPLHDIWVSPQADELRKISVKDFKKCSKCNLHNYCDMCMVYNYNENGGRVDEVCSRFCDVAAMLRNKIHAMYNNRIK